MSATQPIGVDPTPANSEDAVRRQLDALANGEFDHHTFLNNMKERFRFEPDDNWEVLSLLDQYYRRGKISLEVFRALKSGFAEYILGPHTTSSPQVSAPTLHTVVTPAPASAAPAAPAPAAPAPAAAAAVAPAVPAAAPAPVVAPAPVAAAAVAPAVPAAAPAPVAPAAPVAAAPVAPAPIAPAAPAAAAPPVARAPDATAPVARAPTAPVPPVPPAFFDTAAATSTAAAPVAPTREVHVGDVLRNRYRIEAIVAKGASGTVFEANDPHRLNLPPAGKRLAVKVLRTPDPRGAFLSQLRQEFQCLQQLSHPNIVRAFDFDRDGSLAFFTMELLNGMHLNRALHARSGVPLQRPHAFAIIRDVGAAVVYAHSRGVAHGDINPQNVFMTMGGEVRVLGFGAAHKLSANAPAPEFEQASAFSDTHKYASCEVFQGNRPDASDDLYSLSCLAYLLLKGKHPFSDCTSIEARAERLRPLRPAQLSYRQWRTLRAGLHTDRNKRPSDVQAWLDGMELRGAARRLPSPNELIETPAGKPRRLQFAVAAAALIVALIGGGIWLSTNLENPTSHPATEPAVEDLATPSLTARTPVATPPAASPPAAAPPTVQPPLRQTPAQASAPRPVGGPPATAQVSSRPTAAPVAQSGVHTAATPAPKTNAAPLSASAAHPVPVATRVEMAADTLDASPGDSAVHVTVRRKGSLRGETSFTWWTESGTAKPGTDFSPVLPHVQQMRDGESSMVLTVPVISTVRAQPKGFYVGIEGVDGGAQIGARALTQVTLPATN
jgi:serine/threonine protein kinase